MSSQAVLYDIPSRQGTGWSPNPWKTRLVLNYKKIDYKTEWVEYPDIAPKLKSLGIVANDPNSPGYYTSYSSPALTFPDGTHMQDSWPIAHELEKRYPSPSLHLSEPIVIKVRDQVAKIREPLTGFFIPKVAAKLLNERSATYFYEKRKERLGMDLREIEKKWSTEENWEKARAPVKEVGDWLREKGGPFFLGDTVSYADLILVGMLTHFERIDHNLFEKFLEFDDALPKLYEASKEWLEKDD